MEMIWDQRPSITLGIGFQQNHTQTIEKSISIFVIDEYLSAFNTPDDNVMECPECVYS